MAAPTLAASLAHSGNPTTAPTITFGTTAADDILIAAFTNGGSDSDPTISGTTITTGGLTWTKVTSVNGGALTDVNGSVWWTRATGNHTGQTVVAATTNSGSAVGARVSGAITNATPTEVVASALNATGVNALVGAAPSVNETLLLLFLLTDDNIASDTVTATGTPSSYTEQQDALSTGGVDTAAALYSGTGTTASTGTLSWNNARGAGIYQVAILVAVKPPAVVSATLAAPLGSLTGSASATPDHPATLAAPLGALTASASATVEHVVQATADAPLGGLTASASAIVDHPATLAAPLGGLTGTASATVEHGATLAAPLGALTGSASATIEHPATLAASLGELAAAASATVQHEAVLSAPLGALTAEASATVTPGGGEPPPEVEETSGGSAPLRNPLPPYRAPRRDEDEEDLVLVALL